MKVAGVVEALVELMWRGSEDAKASAAGAVWNLAGDNDNKVWASPACGSATWDTQPTIQMHNPWCCFITPEEPIFVLRNVRSWSFLV